MSDEFDEERALEDWLIDNQWGGVGSYDLSFAIVASDWLAAHDAAVRDSVAVAIEAEAGTYPHDSIVQVGFREAAAIARDASQETP